MTWTDTRVAGLRKLWDEGHTASVIAKKLGVVSRDAVIGKAHRLGLASRPSPIKHGGDQPYASPPYRPRVCQYPHGNPGEPGFHFCGKPQQPGSSYCPEHHALTHVKYLTKAQREALKNADDAGA